MIDRATVVQNLLTYITKEVLDGDAEGLDAHTPLLEWGVLNSLETTKLVAHIRSSLNVQVPSQEVHPENFQSIDAVAALVLELAEKRAE